MTNTDFINHIPESELSREAGTPQNIMLTISAAQHDEIDYQIGLMNIINIIGKNTGVNLDAIGRLLGESRKGRGDVLYKQLLDVARQNDEFNHDFLEKTFMLLMNIDATDTRLVNVYPASYMLYAIAPNPIISIEEISIILRGLWKFARGVYYIVVTNNPFKYDGGIAGSGYADAATPGTGGEYAYII